MFHLLEKRPILTIIFVVGVLLLPFLDVLEVTIMEARNFISAREMINDDHWLLTTMNGEPRYQKPPLPTWFTAISAMIFGLDSLWGLRLPAVLMVMLTGVMSYLLSRKLKLSKQQALINGLVCVTSLYVILIIFEAPWDIYAHAFMLTAIYFILSAATAPTRSWGDYFGAVFFIGCSILSKGPVSVYVLLIPFLIAYFGIAQKSFKTHWPWLVLVLLTGLVFGFSWYGYVRITDPETFTNITQKETANWTSYNVRPIYYYWSFFVQSGLWAIPALMSLVYPFLKSRVSHKKVYQLSFWWTLLAVILLSVIPEKKSRYLMPVLIPLALTIGCYLTYLIERFKQPGISKERFLVYGYFGLISAMYTFVFLGLGYMVIYKGISVSALNIFFVLATTICGVTMFMFLKKKRIYPLILMTVFGAVFLSLTILSGINNLPITNTNHNTFDTIEDIEKLPAYAYNFTSPELVWAFGKKIPRLDSMAVNSDAIKTPALLLGCTNCEPTIEKDIHAYSVTLIDTLDLNTQSKSNRNYRKRKTALVYRITKKEGDEL